MKRKKVAHRMIIREAKPDDTDQIPVVRNFVRGKSS